MMMQKAETYLVQELLELMAKQRMESQTLILREV